MLRDTHQLSMGETLLGWMKLGYSRVGMGEAWFGVGIERGHTWGTHELTKCEAWPHGV